MLSLVKLFQQRTIYLLSIGNLLGMLPEQEMKWENQYFAD